MVVAIIGIIALKVDLLGLWKRRDERRLVRAQATCPHCEMRATGAREFVVTGRVVSPPGTIRAQCTMCGRVFGCLRDGAEEAERRFGRIAEEAGMDLATWKARGLD